MRKAMRTLWMSGRKASRGASSCSCASLQTIATLSVLCVSGFFTHTAAAQGSPQPVAARAQVKPTLSPEIMAIHAYAKRS